LLSPSTGPFDREGKRLINGDEDAYAPLVITTRPDHDARIVAIRAGSSSWMT
jgi:hypothetical protein